MSDAFSDFLDAPTPASFLRLRAEIVAQPEYDFAADRLGELTALIETGAFGAVPDKLTELMPGWLLSPRVHAIAAYAAEQTGEPDRAQFERDFGLACLRGIRDSGDGSRARPYPVTHVADEYDLLDALGKEVASQRQVSGEDGVFDLLVCTDGSEVWFDVTVGARPAG
jgi:hypothetical protein